ncbi:hypothetical protein [Paenibacillus borealis]|uniref:hypothetical protein n=1 Tax=Paenibacillus borealis TaxID=160799 RepID=UPI000A761E9F|nr:hypothetical protein [Paenibacillus borealis]
MKYKNNAAEPLEKDEMLPFVQQSWIWAYKRRELLYYGQEFMISYRISTTESG